MRAFFVRPFGVKDGIDFDLVEAVLIRPALERLRTHYGLAIDGGTTGEFIRQGSIREDMFRLLVTADLVVADVSVYNANAFYELGIRHGLRHQHTFLIREKSTAAQHPFDLRTDRYFTYDFTDLSGAVHDLAAALRSTLNSDPNFRDSPVFQLLPHLTPHDRSVLMPVPLDFQEAVTLAQAGGHRGDLRLLAHEAQGFEWEAEGLRLVGNAQFRLKAFFGAKETFELLHRANPRDVRVNLRLGTIYQKLAAKVSTSDADELLNRSDQAIERALGDASTPAERAEAFALHGSNAKTRWLHDVIDKALVAAGDVPAAQERLARVVLFTGHMVDRPDRPADKARFPRTREAEAKARAAIEVALRDELAETGGVSLGIAGGACGADILFHEVCATLGIPTQLYLALPPARFQVESVQHGGPDWVERYRLLCERIPYRVLQDDTALPRWLTDKPDYDVWQRNNLWMMFNALSLDPTRLTLIALYNREREADGPGGTAHLLKTTEAWGFTSIEIDARQLLTP